MPYIPPQNPKEEIKFHDMGLARLENMAILGYIRASVKEATLEHKHNSLESLKDL
jgi:hypothetical protein